MAPAGYSGTPLARKLGIRPGARVLLDGAPEGFADELGELPDGVELKRAARGKAWHHRAAARPTRRRARGTRWRASSLENRGEASAERGEVTIGEGVPEGGKCDSRSCRGRVSLSNA